MRSISKAHIFDAGVNRPRVRKRIGPDGVVVREKLPSIASELWVTAAGNVVALPLSTSAGLRSKNNQAAARMKETQSRAGGIPFGECPVRTLRGLPESMASELPCAPGTYGESRACKHVAQIIESRQAATLAALKENEQRHKSIEAKKLELLEAAQARTVESESVTASGKTGVSAKPAAKLG